MTNTKRQLNHTGVSFTPQGGSAIPATGVTAVAIDDGISLLKFAGDGDRYNTTVVNDFNEVSASVDAADQSALRSWGPGGTVGSFTATHNDAKNLAVSGSFAIQYTLANAIISSRKAGGSHRQFGMEHVDFDSFSSDGVTSPLSITIL